MRPTIGITCDYEYILSSNNTGATGRIMLTEGYYEAVEMWGGVPVVIPIINDDSIEELISSLDGIILSGGGDVDPMYFRESPIREMGSVSPYRDRCELYLAKRALEMDIPILGICRGHQVLNIALGGNIYQDMYKQISSDVIKHVQAAPRWYGSHEVSIKEGTKLYDIIGKNSIYVNSFHHQSIKMLGDDVIASGYSGDGVIEAIESVYHSFAIGVQWHPEAMWERDEDAMNIFKAFVDEARV